MKTLESIINQAWEEREKLTPHSDGPFVDAIHEAINLLDRGELRIAEKVGDEWKTHAWLKRAVLLYFRTVEQVHFPAHDAFDKVPLKFSAWQAQDFIKAGIRVVPGSIVRKGAYIARDAVLMTSFINIAAYVGSRTMVDIYATVGSCAQIGQGCHISSGAVIGGVLEPVQSNPVIIEDDVFVGAQSCLVEGVHIGKGAVIGMGVKLSNTTPIYDRETGKVIYGSVPDYSVVVAGSRPCGGNSGDMQISCAVIVKRVDAKTRGRTSINELLRS